MDPKDLADGLVEVAAHAPAIDIRSFEERDLPRPERFGIQGLHFPIPDMGVPPTTVVAHGLFQTVVAAMDEGLPVLVHCKAGVGRTGTVLACCLIAVGQRADEALLELRRNNPHYRPRCRRSSSSTAGASSREREGGRSKLREARRAGG